MELSKQETELSFLFTELQSQNFFDKMFQTPVENKVSLNINFSRLDFIRIPS